MKKLTIIGLVALVLVASACNCKVPSHKCGSTAKKLQKVTGLDATPKTLFHEQRCKIYFRGSWRSAEDIVEFINTKTEPKALKQ